MGRLKLHHAIVLAMGLGIAIALLLRWAQGSGLIAQDELSAVAHAGQELGGLWLRLLQMLVIPLIVASLISAITSMGQVRSLGRLGARVMLFYAGSSLLAITTGILLVNLIEPGLHADLDLVTRTSVGGELGLETTGAQSIGAILWAQLTHMIPKNPLKAAADGDMLPVIFFSILLGFFINVAEHEQPDPAHGPSARTSGEAARTLREFFAALFEVMMRMTLFVVRLAPFGVFGFMLYAAASQGWSAFEALGLYALTVLAGLAVHGGLTIPILVRVLGGRHPLRYAKALSPALVTAFSTASSNGTLPLTMRCIEERAAISPKVSAFVLPLGATINMDGTALYEAVAVLFIAQLYGIDLSVGAQIVVALTALLASVGAAGIPHAGTVMMVVVLSAVGLPTTAVGLILAVDRVLDMCRTAINVWSDSAAAAFIAASEGEGEQAATT